VKLSPDSSLSVQGPKSSQSHWRNNSRTNTGDTSRSGFIYAKQEQSKNALQTGGREDSRQRGVLRWGSQDLELLLGSVDMGVVSPGKLALCVINFQRVGYASSTPPTHKAGEFLGLDGQIRAVMPPGHGVLQDVAVCRMQFCQHQQSRLLSHQVS
jgi:hypothetical protein